MSQSITIYTVHCSFPNMERDCVRLNRMHVYQNMFTKLLSARRMLRTVSLQCGDSPLIKDVDNYPKEARKKILSGETFHNFPIATYSQVVNEKTASLIGSNVRHYQITAYRLKIS